MHIFQATGRNSPLLFQIILFPTTEQVLIMMMPTFHTSMMQTPQLLHINLFLTEQVSLATGHKVTATSHNLMRTTQSLSL